MWTSQGLTRIKTRALRGRVWFKATSTLERSIVDLTIRCVKRIRSPVLARTVSAIIGKILATLENGFLTKAEKIGVPIAERLCGFAVAWGNRKATNWRQNLRFIQFLGVNAINADVHRL